jgi:hypothetical protein
MSDEMVWFMSKAGEVVSCSDDTKDLIGWVGHHSFSYEVD